MKELIVGRWYKNLRVDEGYIGKLTGPYVAVDNRFPSTDFIYPDGSYTSQGTQFRWNSKDLVEVPFSEIQQYLPKEYRTKLKLKII